MTDIVERLRACQGVLTHDPECNCEEAADEIERLRTQLAIQFGMHPGGDLAKAAQAEIERLRLTPQEAYLQIVEGWLRDNRGIHFPEGAVDDLCQRIARRALEPKP